MNPFEALSEHFQPDPVFGQRVVLFRDIQSAGPLQLVRELSREWRPYAAIDCDEDSMLKELESGDDSFLAANRVDGCMVEFESDSTAIRRVKFRFIRKEGQLNSTLTFTTARLAEPASVTKMLAEISQFAAILGARSYSVHYEINSEWNTGDFSNATLIYRIPEVDSED